MFAVLFTRALLTNGCDCDWRVRKIIACVLQDQRWNSFPMYLREKIMKNIKNILNYSKLFHISKW